MSDCCRHPTRSTTCVWWRWLKTKNSAQIKRRVNSEGRYRELPFKKRADLLTSSVPRGLYPQPGYSYSSTLAPVGVLVVKYDIKSTNRIWLLLDRICILVETAFSEAPWWIKARAVVIIHLWRPGRFWLVFVLLACSKPPPCDQRKSQIRPHALPYPPWGMRHAPQAHFKAAGREPRGGKQKNTETGWKYWRGKKRSWGETSSEDDSLGQNKSRREEVLTAGPWLQLSPVRQEACVSVFFFQPDKKFWTGRVTWQKRRDGTPTAN